MSEVAGNAAGGSASNSSSIFLQIVENPDGTITRPSIPASPPTGDDHPNAALVHCKDVPLNPAHATWLRIYRPNPPPSHKLPIVVFFHGGGFVIFGADSVIYHESCEQMTSSLPAIVVALDYRLAPESRLPAAYDDGTAALLWVLEQAKNPAGDPWLASHGDFSRCCVMGSSSGANMAYHVGLRAKGLDLSPLGLVGLVLHQPYMGGVERTPSEAASEDDPVLPLCANDMLWRLALPEEADRDHKYSNLVKSMAAAGDEKIVIPRCLVVGFKGDPLYDRQREFAKVLEEAGANVVARLDDEGFHAMELFVPAMAEVLFAYVREFIDGGGSS